MRHWGRGSWTLRWLPLAAPAHYAIRGRAEQADAPDRGQRRPPHLPARAWRAAGQEAQLTLHLLRDEKPAPDLAPFLGVAAHAVFIDASDLT